MDHEPTQDALLPIQPEVVAALVNHHREFRTFLSTRVSDIETAEDLLQLSLKKAMESPPASHAEQSVLAWFYQILRNTLVDHYRRAATEAKNRDAVSAEFPSQVEAPDETKALLCQCMKHLLPALKPAYAELLSRIDLGGESPQAVAQSLGLSRNNLDVRLHRARQALKTSLIRSCGSCTTHGCLDCTCNSN